MALLDGKTGIVFGVANKRSIAWAIAQSLAREGMRLAFTYQGERLKESVEALTSAGMPGSLLLPCDVTNDAEIAAVFQRVDEEFGRLDAMLHSVAYAPKEDLENDFVNTSRDGFKLAHDISAYSLVALSKAALPLFEKSGGGSVLGMSYYGGVKAVEGYNVMGGAKATLEAWMRYMARDLGPSGIRVNAISAGAMRTLAIAGIQGGRGLIATGREWSVMKEDTTMEGIGGCALWLLSDLGRSTTGEVVHVDAGFHIVGVPDTGGE